MSFLSSLWSWHPHVWFLIFLCVLKIFKALAGVSSYAIRTQLRMENFIIKGRFVCLETVLSRVVQQRVSISPCPSRDSTYLRCHAPFLPCLTFCWLPLLLRKSPTRLSNTYRWMWHPSNSGSALNCSSSWSFSVAGVIFCWHILLVVTFFFLYDVCDLFLRFLIVESSTQ